MWMFGLGVLCGVATTIVFCTVLVLVAFHHNRQKKRSAIGLIRFLGATIKRDGGHVHKLMASLGDIGPLQIEFNCPRKKPLTEKEMGFVMLLRGIDTLVRNSSVPWSVVDGVIQKCMEYSLVIDGQNQPEPGQEP